MSHLVRDQQESVTAGPQKQLCSSGTCVTADCMAAEVQLLTAARHHGEDKSSRCVDFLVSQ